MNVKWGTVLLYVGVALILQSTRCDAGSRVVDADATDLAKETGAAHFEEHFEPIESSEESGEHRLRKRASDEDLDYEVYQGVVGRPGIDFPIHSRIPQTSFSCRQYGGGYFADLETDCQVFHICDGGRKISFLCPNGTIFQQPELICDWWFKVNCGKSPGFYADSAEILSRGQNHKKSHKHVENDYNSSGKKNSYRTSSKSNVNKSQYPLKSSRRYEESDRLNQAKLSDRRIDSEENVSVESVDFEDITEGTRTYHRKSDKFQASTPRENENESQVVAETASFVSNNGRNGYGYDNPIPDRKSSAERGYTSSIASQRAKNDRGRQKYNDVRSNVYKNLNLPGSQEASVEASTVQPLAFQQNINKGSAVQFSSRSQSRFSTPRPNSYTTARRIDVTKTTPYYTPTVPTVGRFGEYRATPTTTVKTGFASTPFPFAQRKGPIQTQQNDRFNQGSSTEYFYSKPSSFKTASTTPAAIRTTYFTPDGRRPAVDIHLQPGTGTSTPGYFSTTNRTPTQTTSGYDYSPFSTIPPNSVGFGQTKLSSPAPFTVFGSAERTTRPADVIIENHFGSKKQNLQQSVTSTAYSQVKTESVEILSNDQPTSHDVNFKVTTDLPVETITGNSFIDSGKEKSGRLIASAGYAYDNPSTRGNAIPTTNTFGFSTVSNQFTTTFSPAQSTPPRPETEGSVYNAFDQKRNILNSGVNAIQTTTYKPQDFGSTGYSVQGIVTSTTAPPVSTIAPQFGYGSTTTNQPGQSTTIVPEEPVPTTYRPLLTTTQPTSVMDHIKDMIKTLHDLKVPLKVGSRDGLEIPSSSGPSSLHSLAEYFASAESTSTTEASVSTDDNVSGDHEDSEVEVKSDLDHSHLTGHTVTKYKDLFGLSTTTSLPDLDVVTFSPRFLPNNAGDTNDLDGQHSSSLLGDNLGKPETRKIAQVFTNALSAYLQDPASFRKVLSEVRPTEPPAVSDAEFAHGSAASYLPTIPTTVIPTTQSFAQTTLRAIEGRDSFDFSAVTGKPNYESESTTIQSTTFGYEGTQTTTQEPSYANPATITAIPNYTDKVPASRLITENLRRQGDNHESHTNLQVETESNGVAAEVNTGLGMSTIVPYLSLAESIAARNPTVGVNTAQPTTYGNDNGGEWSTTASPPTVAFELLPPSADGDANADDDEDTLQRAQSQSFVTARNNFNRFDIPGKHFESLKLSTTISPRNDYTQSGHFITRLMYDSPTTTEIPDYKRGTVTSWPPTTSYTSYVDPLTINDGLMVPKESPTTTGSPHTYLPRSTPPQPTPIDVDIADAGQFGASTIRGFLHPDIPDDVLPPSNGIQRIANKMFGNLDADSANHLMNVMKKAESNATVRKLILLLIQTCDQDYGKTVEQSRKILLNALIGMDQKLEGNEQVQVFNLQPERQSRSEKLIASTVSPTTSYTSPHISTTYNYESESSSTVQPTSGEETTRFQTTRAGDSAEDNYGISSTVRPVDSEYSTVVSTQEPHIYSTPVTQSEAQTTSQPETSRRRTKDVSDSIGQVGFESDLSHKNSDERALELLKSLYSLASKFSRR